MQNIKSLFWEKKSQLEVWFQNLNFSSLDFIRFISFFGIGFLGGLFFKRWSKYIIFVAISLAIVLALLQGFSIISINFSTIQRLTGLQNIKDMSSMFLAFLEIAKKYMRELICSGIGFIVGFKTG
ncbi:MAG: hypothetical protein JO129_02220 [Candidatus Dependentiae bacterium]|nr:hypothetical protein [Candidatus Dependentiae bacterium]